MQICHLLAFPDLVENAADKPERIKGLKDAPYFQPVDIDVLPLGTEALHIEGVTTISIFPNSAPDKGDAMNLIERIRTLFTRVRPLPEGMHHLEAAPPDEKPYRLHLRLRSDGSGTLIVNAATVLHLNPTAAEYAYHFIRGASDEQTAGEIAGRYRISKSQATVDFREFVDRIQTLIHTPDLDPVSFLDMDRVAPHTEALTAPLRLDCALTYSLPPGADASDAPAKRVTRELTTDEWRTVLDTAWAAGVPHIIFTGGEPTLRPDLPALIVHAEKNGQVAGLLTDGLKLADKAYLDTLLQTGLDHLLVILQPENEQSWRALGVILPEDIFTAAHLTLTPARVAALRPTLERLTSLGVTAVSFSAAPDMRDALETARDLAAEFNLSLVWDLPVPYSASNPVALETVADSIPSGAGKSWVYVEPDGDVLPAQGMAGQVLGNLLTSNWKEIYPTQAGTV